MRRVGKGVAASGQDFCALLCTNSVRALHKMHKNPLRGYFVRIYVRLANFLEKSFLCISVRIFVR